MAAIQKTGRASGEQSTCPVEAFGLPQSPQHLVHLLTEANRSVPSPTGSRRPTWPSRYDRPFCEFVVSLVLVDLNITAAERAALRRASVDGNGEHVVLAGFAVILHHH